MFNRIYRGPTCSLRIEDEFYPVPEKVNDYISELKRTIHDLENENLELTKKNISTLAKLDAIKPVVNSPKYEPALSRDCIDCKYVVKSSWDRTIIGCRKNNVCGDFVREQCDEE